MSLTDDFYNKILNIKNNDIEEKVQKIVKDEQQKLASLTSSFEGYCKYLCSQIQERLILENIEVITLDLNELVSFDHVSLLVRFRSNDEIKTLLIDPTFIQFVGSNNKSLIRLSKWPSEKINPELLHELLANGYAVINNDLFNSYLNSFLTKDLVFNLDEYIFNKKSEKFLK